MALPNNKWDCSACTYLNWSSSVKCSLCGCSRSTEVTPKGTVAKIKSYTQNSLSISKLSPHDKSLSPGEHRSTNGGDKWICVVCTYCNIGRASACVMCHSLRTEDNTRSPMILDFASSSNTSSSRGGAVGGVSCVEPPDSHGKKHLKQRHSSDNKSKRWKCPNCTYENYPKSTRCTMCGVSRVGGNSAGGSGSLHSPRLDDSVRRKVSVEDDMRQIRNRLSMMDWLFLHACEGVVTGGDVTSVKHYLKSGGDKLRQLTSKEVMLLGGQTSRYPAGSSLIDLALRLGHLWFVCYLILFVWFY